jgi:LysM repeat protein
MFIVPKKALEAEKSQPPPPPPPDPTVPEFEKAKAVRRTGKLLEARETLTAFVERYPESTKIDEAKSLLGNINTDLFLSTRPAPEKEVYIVKPGDVINRVANKLKVTPELLMRANNLEATMLRIGQKLTVTPADFSVIISRKYDKVTLLNKGRFFKQYAIHSWPPAHLKKPLAAGQKAPLLPKQSGKVKDKIAWLDGQRVIFTDKGFWNAKFWIEISIPGCTLYPDPGENAPETPNSKPINGGIALAPDALTELGALLSKDDPVTLE